MNIRTLFLIPILFSLSFFACDSGSGKKPATSFSDSTAYISPAPGEISLQDFERYYNAIKEFYDKDFVARGFNGAILVAKKGRVIFEDYHGYFNLSKKDSLTAHSAFHLASVSKTFTAMAALKLVEMGKLKLDDDVKTILGYECKKAIVKLKNGSIYNMYYTTAIIPSASENPFEFKDVPGFVLEYETGGNKSSKITYTAIQINFDPVPASKFKIPTSGYRVLE